MNKLLVAGILALVGLGTTSAAYAQRGNHRPVVAVADFQNDTGAGWWRGGVGRELGSMLANELSSTGDFRVVEREKLGAVLSEQDLAASGRVRSGTGAATGELTGAQYLIMGTVSAYEENTASTGGGVSFRGISLGGKRSEAYLAVDLRVVDASTGEVAFSRTVEGRSSGGGVSVGVFRGGFGGSLANERNTPAGKAIRAALVEITDYLSCAMVQQSRGCEAEYQEKENRRRDSNRRGLRLD
ncbi:CsgG/HfaB family protein [Pseudofulvimonas gallinarii]|jgi:curli biogenesis system outer membrane secretion channel CsgG|uniref:Curli production assembly/transport component CsgG n=1 Tax=Pseudofulvimonas gallinarii TaxID=634155 RepID=A0A4R3LBE5_9GAMM|nr:CsgG/HfaB family protein [Pseudofulvimonas gallinarii]TCS97203.1 curli biogenesis system outer membrane secretion channel CsgG [Pseudofulvimonas gallinarii]THD12523.1 penicillin-binding protein activator LpoB [Pseudofulvimonas gallinarii]